MRYSYRTTYNATNQRNNSEMPASTIVKKRAIKIQVERTTIVYRVSSFRFGQLTFRISETTFLKKPLMLPIILKTSEFQNHSISPGIQLKFISFVYARYAHCNEHRIF